MPSKIKNLQAGCITALGTMGFQSYKNSYYSSIYTTIISISYFKDDSQIVEIYNLEVK